MLHMACKIKGSGGAAEPSVSLGKEKKRVWRPEDTQGQPEFSDLLGSAGVSRGLSEVTQLMAWALSQVVLTPGKNCTECTASVKAILSTRD